MHDQRDPRYDRTKYEPSTDDPPEQNPNPQCDSPIPGLSFPGSDAGGSPVPLTQLDPHETSGGSHRDGRSYGLFDPRLNLVLNFRHSFWGNRRRATYLALQAACNQDPSVFGVKSTGYVGSFAPVSLENIRSYSDSSCVDSSAISTDSRDALHTRARASLDVNTKTLRAMSDLSYVLPHTETTPLRLLRFAQCGCDSWVMASVESPPRYRILSNRCRDRFCEACQRERRRTVSNNVALQLEGRDLRLLTLTLKSSTDPLRAQLNRLYKCFRLFRNRKAVRHRMTGGLFFCELTLNDRTRLWHPHLHIIFEGQYLPHELAKRSWLAVTGDSFIVDVRALRSSQEAADYVAKYASKGISPRVWLDKDRMVEAILSLSGRRTFSVFGLWKGLNLSQSPHDECDWVYFGRLDDVIILAKTGDDECLGVMKMLLSNVQFETADYARSPPPDEAR